MGSAEGRSRGEREVRLEGPLLWIAGGLLLASLVGAFWIGRTFGRWETRVSAASAPDDETAGRAPETVDATEDLTFFDKLTAGGQQAEPRRETRPGSPAAPERPAPTPAVQTPGGPWFVQVFAGRDRASAEVVVRALKAKGEGVRVDAERDGGGALYKVRVGGFPSRETADVAAERLRGQGHPGAWVTKIGG